MRTQNVFEAIKCEQCSSVSIGKPILGQHPIKVIGIRLGGYGGLEDIGMRMCGEVGLVTITTVCFPTICSITSQLLQGSESINTNSVYT